MFLAGDVGGTKVNLALCEVKGLSVVAHSPRRYASHEFAGLAQVLLTYFKEVGSSPKAIRGACFGVPGPVMNGRCQTVNLPWSLDVAEIQNAIQATHPIAKMKLMNDLAATAYGIRTLSNGLSTLRPGKAKEKGNEALIAPGTGLGEAIMFWDGGRHVVSSSEGGHTDFGPQDEEQIELLRWLWPRHKHVSWEHVASGPGIYRIYRFLKESGREQEPPELAELFARPGFDPSPVIAKRAHTESAGICAHTMALWLFFLGAEAGNLALKTLCSGGLFIAGGIVPNILELLNRADFLRGFESKGRMTAVLEGVPIYAVTDPLTGLYGAALGAAELDS